MIDVQEHFDRLDADTQIWKVPQFTVSDVCAITGITPKALEHFVDPKRDLVALTGNHANPGKGKRRIFTGEQVLMIKAAYVMSEIGFPQRFSRTLATTVATRANSVTIGLSMESEMTLINYPMKNGDWTYLPMYAHTKEMPKLPLAVQVLDVDRLIGETKAQLEAIVSGDDIPDFTIPDIEPENPCSPKSNFFGNWDKDEQGRWKYVGLTFDESQELLQLTGMRLNGDDLETFEMPKLTFDQTVRRSELQSRHSAAR